MAKKQQPKSKYALIFQTATRVLDAMGFGCSWDDEKYRLTYGTHTGISISTLVNGAPGKSRHWIETDEELQAKVCLVPADGKERTHLYHLMNVANNRYRGMLADKAHLERLARENGSYGPAAVTDWGTRVGDTMSDITPEGAIVSLDSPNYYWTDGNVRNNIGEVVANRPDSSLIHLKGFTGVILPFNRGDMHMMRVREIPAMAREKLTEVASKAALWDELISRMARCAYVSETKDRLEIILNNRHVPGSNADAIYTTAITEFLTTKR